jgi:hypothetical protein
MTFRGKGSELENKNHEIIIKNKKAGSCSRRIK